MSAILRCAATGCNTPTSGPPFCSLACSRKGFEDDGGKEWLQLTFGPNVTYFNPPWWRRV